jgi:hypothetical protein
MRSEVFEKLYDNIMASFSRRVDDSAKSRCYVRVKHVPDAAAKHILAHLEDMERPPANIPKAMLAAYYSWRDANVDQAADAKDHCLVPECQDGAIFGFEKVYTNGKEQWVRVAVPCAECCPGEYSMYPSNLQDNGVLVATSHSEMRNLEYELGICPEPYSPTPAGWIKSLLEGKHQRRED